MHLRYLFEDRMSKAAVFTMTLEADLRAEFLAAAEASHRPAAQVMRELMREFVLRERDRLERHAFLRRKVEMARISSEAGIGRANDVVAIEFAERRKRVADRA